MKLKFLIISHVRHKQDGHSIGGYGPYVREMNLWLKHTDAVRVVAPLDFEKFDPIDLVYQHPNLEFVQVPAFDLTNMKRCIRTVLVLPIIMFRLYQAMRWANHIHIRSPGNMGLIACFVQMFFPSKLKSAKYAANWNLKAKKPWSYRLQQWILRNPVLSRNMSVMVYGSWPGYTRNMVNFFTATYYQSELAPVEPRQLSGLVKLIFVGRLVVGKRPVVAVEALAELLNAGYEASLDIYGDGPEMGDVQGAIQAAKLHAHVRIHGNTTKEVLKIAFRSAHFLLFPTVMSEGWPKVVAESMFWGCVPVTTSVSCVPYMLDYGSRGALVNPNPHDVAKAIDDYLINPEKYLRHAYAAMNWSRQYTLDCFESEIIKLLDRGVGSE